MGVAKTIDPPGGAKDVARDPIERARYRVLVEGDLDVERAQGLGDMVRREALAVTTVPPRMSRS